MSDSQYAVFHFDVKTMSMRDAEGRDPEPGKDAPRIFDSLAAAEHYCRQKVASTPSLGCRIYDRGGTTVQTFANGQIYEEHHGLPAAKRNLLIGGACFATGVASVALDAWFGWRLILGVVLGVRFLWVGTTKMIEGVSTLIERAGRKAPS